MDYESNKIIIKDSLEDISSEAAYILKPDISTLNMEKMGIYLKRNL